MNNRTRSRLMLALVAAAVMAGAIVWRCSNEPGNEGSVDGAAATIPPHVEDATSPPETGLPTVSPTSMVYEPLPPSPGSTCETTHSEVRCLRRVVPRSALYERGGWIVEVQNDAQSALDVTVRSEGKQVNCDPREGIPLLPGARAWYYCPFIPPPRFTRFVVSAEPAWGDLIALQVTQATLQHIPMLQLTSADSAVPATYPELIGTLANRSAIDVQVMDIVVAFLDAKGDLVARASWANRNPGNTSGLHAGQATVFDIAALSTPGVSAKAETYAWGRRYPRQDTP